MRAQRPKVRLEGSACGSQIEEGVRIRGSRGVSIMGDVPRCFMTSRTSKGVQRNEAENFVPSSHRNTSKTLQDFAQPDSLLGGISIPVAISCSITRLCDTPTSGWRIMRCFSVVPFALDASLLREIPGVNVELYRVHGKPTRGRRISVAPKPAIRRLTRRYSNVPAADDGRRDSGLTTVRSYGVRRRCCL